jgi:hypothetical protein
LEVAALSASHANTAAMLMMVAVTTYQSQCLLNLVLHPQSAMLTLTGVLIISRCLQMPDIYSALSRLHGQRAAKRCSIIIRMSPVLLRPVSYQLRHRPPTTAIAAAWVPARMAEVAESRCSVAKAILDHRVKSCRRSYRPLTTDIEAV